MITKKQIEGYLAIREKRHALDRQSAALEKEEHAIEAKLRECVAAYGGRDRTTMRHGYVLAIQTVPGSIRWKEECIKAIGDAAAAALPKPTRLVLHVEPVAKQPLAAEQ